MSEHLWIPSEEEAAAAHISAFIEMVGRELGAAHPTYGDLYAWSVEEPERFWSALWDFVGIIAETRGKSVIEDGRNMIGARFFPGARLSFAENLLRRRDSGIAVIARSEDGVRRFVTHQDLYDQVSRIAQALLALGMSPEDRIAAILPNVPETLAGMLAANSIGAIWTSCSPEFGARGIADRLGQVDPKVLFVVESYCYKGRRYDVSGSLEEFRVRLPGVEHVIVVPAPGEDGPPRPEEGAIPFADFVAPFAPAEIAFARLPFDHPAFIVYTSGTTDQPKCIVHGAGRVLLQFLKEHWLHFDVRPGDRFFFTTTGWNIWYTLVTSLGAGGTVVMYDGAPFHPHAGVLFDLVEEEGITHFGTSPTYIEAVKRAGLAPRTSHDLSSLKTILSTGSPLSPECFDYVYDHIKKDVRLSSISGGTEIMTTFANGNPIGPVYRGELQARTLGMAVQVFDSAGRAVREEKGELVCTAPFPSRPLGFWNDPGDRRYHDNYFRRFANVWAHGDYAELTAHEGLIIYGRPDTILNRGGVRIGTAEIYRPVEAMAAVADALVVGHERDGGERVVLFVQLSEGVTLDDTLVERIKARVRRDVSPRHVPDQVVQVGAIPYTLNGKKAELAVKNELAGRPAGNVDSLANPEALEAFASLAELES